MNKINFIFLENILLSEKEHPVDFELAWAYLGCDILPHQIKDYGEGFPKSLLGIPSFSLTRFRL
jgi:hypothetical protein